MDLRRTKSKFTREQRLAIIEEYEKGTLTGKEIAQKYGFRSPSVIYNWPEELEAEVKRLTKELEWAKLQNKALNTLIDIAEEQGIQIRKKSGAKQ